MKKLVAISLLLLAMSCVQEPDLESLAIDTEYFTDFGFYTVNVFNVNL
ncbi:MAG: hypothetical protein ACJAZV_000470 [Roseivirga sp.]|jgi:hypothetical protein